MKSGNLNFLEPSGPLQACDGTASPFRSRRCGYGLDWTGSGEGTINGDKFWGWKRKSDITFSAESQPQWEAYWQSVTRRSERNFLTKCRVLQNESEFGITLLLILSRSDKRSNILVLIRSNKIEQYVGIYLLQNYCTCFGCPSYPSSGVHKTVTAASGTGHSIWATAFLQRGQRPKATLEEGCCSDTMTCTKSCSYSFMYSWWWVRWTPPKHVE